MNIRLFAALAVTVLLLAACGQKEAIRFDGKTVSAKGWSGPDGDWPHVLRVYASTDPDAPPVTGSYARHGDRIVFKPALPPSPSVTLRAVYRLPDGSLSTAVFPARRGPAVAASTKVTAVYPSATTWPANTSKLYIQFSAPMSQGQAWTHIHLLDAAGQPMAKPFVEIDQELWNPAGDRLTVLFDPGRLKPGLTAHDAAGAPLVAGRRYTLKIDADWKDAAGAPLAAGFDKPVTAGPDLRQPVEPSAWKLNAPKVDEALIVRFPHPMDAALARTVISVRQAGKPVAGQVTLDAEETRWVFVPARAWKPGEYQLHVEGILEDIAGNRVGRLIDADTTDQARTIPPSAAVDLPFKVG